MAGPGNENVQKPCPLGKKRLDGADIIVSGFSDREGLQCPEVAKCKDPCSHKKNKI